MEPAGGTFIKPKFQAPSPSNNVFGYPGEKYLKSLKSDYFQVIENPKRLPFFFHPMFGLQRETTVHRTFFSPSIFLKDSLNVPRQLYFNFDAENMAIGATGGLLIGLATHQYFLTHGRLAKLTAQNWLQNVESGKATILQRAGVGSIVATTVVWRIVKRAAVGALMFDVLKRTSAQEQGEGWLNSAFAGGVCGAAFGMRGGYHTAILGLFGFGLGATFQHLLPSMISD